VGETEDGKGQQGPITLSFSCPTENSQPCSLGRWMGEVKELSSRHFIYLASSNLYITCILQKREAEGQKMKCLIQDHLVASGKFGILNRSPFNTKDLALESHGLLL